MLLITLVSFGQTLERQTIGASGTDFSNSSIIVSQTVGELAVTSFSNSSIVVMEGFQQNTPISTSLIELEVQVEVKAYPNPTSDFLDIKINSEESLTLSIEIRDITGRKLHFQKENVRVNGSYLESLDLSNLSSGNYLVSLLSKNAQIGSFKIIKN
jgi:hypothetical protein